MWEALMSITEAAAYAALEALERAREALKKQVEGGRDSTWISTMSSTSPG